MGELASRIPVSPSGRAGLFLSLPSPSPLLQATPLTPPSLENTKRKIFNLHTSKMSLSSDVDLDEFISQKDDLSGADIKAICSEAGLMALRERRMQVQMADFRAARDRVMKTKTEEKIEGLYL